MLDNKITKKKRIWELDFLRGICIIMMVLDHICLSIYFFFDDIWSQSSSEFIVKLSAFAVNMYDGEYSHIRDSIRPFILFFFFSLCGLSSSFSKNNFARGIKLAICSMLYSLGSYILMPDDFIVRFGVLHMLSFCILFWAIIRYFIKDKYSASGFAFFLSLMLYSLYKALPTTGIKLSNDSFWTIFTGNLSTNAGLISPGDYFPVLPNLCLFLLGATAASLLYPNKQSLFPKLDGCWSKPIEFLGRNTLIIMLLHLVVISILFALITALFIDKGNWVFI